jgi:branched-chain amino acid transport system permease protein
MEVFVAQLINGLSLGSVYVLLVTGFNLLLLVALVIHFSYPQVVVLSMYAAWMTLRAASDHPGLAVLAALFASVLLSLATAPLFQKITQRKGRVDVNITMVVSLGIGMIIGDLLSRVVNNGFPVAFPPPLTGSGPVIHVGLVSVSWGQIAALVGGVVIVGSVFLILYTTRQGRAFRAIAEDPVGALLAGIPVASAGLRSHALAGVVGGVTAVILAALMGFASPGLGEQVAHKVLAVSIIAGLGHLGGGLVVGLCLGVLEALVQGYVSGTWSNAVAFVLMLVVVLLRPRGLFGSKV